MGKKALPNNRKADAQSTGNRSKRNLNGRKCETQTSQTSQLKNGKNKLPSKETKKEVCSVCLNSIEKPSVCSGCFHLFCFSCIAKWANVSKNCPVCRQEYKTILHNFNTTVKIIKFEDEPTTGAQTDDSSLVKTKNGDTNQKAGDKFYIFETGELQMIGVPITNDEHITNNIVQLNTRNKKMPEIDIVNMTRNENGGRIITRHNYQLASGDEQELINQLITSAVNRSVEEHNETIAQINTKNATLPSDSQQSNLALNHNRELTRLIDIYTFDRTRRMNRRRNQNINLIPTNTARYNLRSIAGMRVNPMVNRSRLDDSN